MVSKIESKCRSGAEYSLSQSSLSITNQNKDYNSNKRIALFTLSSSNAVVTVLVFLLLKTT